MTYRLSGALIISLVLFCLGGIQPVSAQLLNVESYRSAIDTSQKWNAQIDIGITATKQKKSVINASNGVQLYYNREPWSVLLLHKMQLVRLQQENLISSGYLHGRAGYWINSKWALENFIQYQYDIVRGLDARRLFGGGARHVLFSQSNLEFVFGVGFMQELERWDLSEEDNAERALQLKSTNYLSLSYTVSPQLTMRLISYYQAPPKSFWSPRLIADARLDLKINKYLSLAVSWSSTYDYDPVTNVEPFVYTLSNSLIARF